MAKKRARAKKKPRSGGHPELSPEVVERCIEIAVRTDSFCDRHLNDEYKSVCREIVHALCRPDSPVLRGKVESWSGGVIYAAGRINFLTDPSQSPHMTAEEIAKAAGVSPATMHNKFREVKEYLDLMPFQPEFTVASRLNQNPLVWMLKVNGFLMDIREAPREAQVVAFQQGLIPWIPADR